jgi:hypothetical protein
MENQCEPSTGITLPVDNAPSTPKAYGADLYWGSQWESREAAHITSESTPLSVLLLFFAEIITFLVVEMNLATITSS